MILSDFSLLGKKIVLAIVVALVPILILLGGLWGMQKVLKADDQATETLLIQKK
ncbi:MAG: hypothetical protein V4714_05345 [Bacteroidota bacterium]